jgi:hypothetical protein
MDFMRRQGLAGNTQPQQSTQQQTMTPPTIHADIIQIGTLDEMDQYSVAPGASQMFMTRDEQIIAVRSMFANNQHSDDIYDKRPPAPPAPTLNPAEYVRKDELQAMLSELLQARTTPVKTTTKKEEAE